MDKIETEKTRIILNAVDLDGFLQEEDQKELEEMKQIFKTAMSHFEIISSSGTEKRVKAAKDAIIESYSVMGQKMQELIKNHPHIHVYSFQQPSENHGEASRLIAKLRDVNTENHEFIYYIQRAYELLFNLAYQTGQTEKNHLIVKTPVTSPVQNYAVHKIPDVDRLIEDSVMCVMLRGALLPSMIMSKEIQEYSSTGYITPFALFRIKRDDRKHEHDMDYILDLKSSYYNLEALQDKDLIFTDPMNATGGSLVTIVKYLKEQGVKPRSIKFFNVISSLKGALQVVRAMDDIEVYTLWMDPVLNDSAYILPGLGDAGDRLNGTDKAEQARNIIQLIADYGSGISQLYRSQVRTIERTVLGTMEQI